MDAAHLHLVLNHLPVVGTIVGLGLLSTGLLRKSDELVGASLVIFVFAAVIAIPTYFTGTSAEDLVEHLSGVTAPLIERHEDAALVSVVALELLGVIAAGALIARRSRRLARALTTAALLVSITTVGLVARTANLGGQIRHLEIRSSASTAAAGVPGTGAHSMQDSD